MHKGTVKDVVMSDKLIIRLGEEWLAKNSRNKLHRGNYTSERIMRAARLLIECKERMPNKTTMEDFLIPQCVDIIIEATLACAGSEGAFNMRNPSIAQKLHDDLIRMAESKELLAIQSGHKNQQTRGQIISESYERRMAPPSRQNLKCCCSRKKLPKRSTHPPSRRHTKTFRLRKGRPVKLYL